MSEIVTHLHDTQASSSVNGSKSAKGGAGKVSAQGSGPKEDDNLADMSDDDDEEEEKFFKGDLVQIVNREELYHEIQNKLWEVTPEPEGVRERYLKQLGGQGTYLKQDLKRSRDDDIVFEIQTPYGKQNWHSGMVRKVNFEEKAEKVATIKDQRRVLQKKKFMGRAYIDAYKALKTREKYRQPDLHSESKYKVDYEDPLAEWVKLYDSDNDERVCVGEVYVKFVLLSKSSASQQPDYPAALFAGSAKDGFKRTIQPFPKLRPYKAFLGMQMLSQIPLHVPLLVNPPKVDEEATLASRRGKSKKKDQRIKFLIKCSVPPAYECRKLMNTDGYKDVGNELSELKYTDEVSCSMECYGFRNPATRAVLVNKVLEVDVPMPPPDLSRKHAPALTLSIGTTRRSKVEATLVLLLGDYLKVSTTGTASEQDGWVDSSYEPVNEYPFYVRGGIEAYHRHKRKQFGVSGTFPKTDVALVKQRYNHVFTPVDPSKFVPEDINALNTEYGHEIDDEGWQNIEQAMLEPETFLNDKDDPGMSEKMIELQMAEIDWPTGDAEVNLEGLEDVEDEDTYEQYVQKELEAEEGYKDGLDTWPLLIGYVSKRAPSLWERLFSRSRTSMGIVGAIKGKVAVVSREVIGLAEYALCIR